MGGWRGGGVNIVFLYSLSTLTGEEGWMGDRGKRKGDREEEMSSGEDGVRIK